MPYGVIDLGQQWPDSTQPKPEPMLTDHLDFVAFTWKQFQWNTMNQIMQCMVALWAYSNEFIIKIKFTKPLMNFEPFKIQGYFSGMMFRLCLSLYFNEMTWGLSSEWMHCFANFNIWYLSQIQKFSYLFNGTIFFRFRTENKKVTHIRCKNFEGSGEVI